MIKINNQGLPAIHLAPSSEKIMWQVSLSTLPLLIFNSFISPRRLAIVLLAIFFALILEGILLVLRKKSLIILKDGSAVLSALLLALCLPITAQPILIFWGVFFAIIIAKGLYGGLGQNIFNPAMFAFVALLISFPAQMSFYSLDYLGFFNFFENIDAQSAATILDKLRENRILELEIQNPKLTKQIFISLIIYFFTALFLIKKNYIDFKITVLVLFSAFLTALIFWLFNSEKYLNPLGQLLSGALIFGSIFIATDPITSPITPIGKVLYSLSIGILTICIRNLGNFPDGFAFAVLFTNALNPLLDQIRPKYE